MATAAMAGFTLIEVMVVLAIVGLGAAGLGLSLGTLAGRETEGEIERLRLALETAADRAALRGRPLAAELLPGGYRFSGLDERGDWVALAEPPLTEHPLPPEIRWQTLALEGRPAPAPRIVFGAAMPEFALVLATPDGIATLAGRPDGSVTHRREARP